MAASRISFENFSLKELKLECQRRGAKLTGRKSELVERLEAYERNRNFGLVDVQRLSTAEYVMSTPTRSLYKDVNTDSKLPPTTFALVNPYLPLKEDHHALYEERHINFIRHVEENNYSYIYAQVRASMKKNCTYYVDVQLHPDGQVVESQCECAVGMGPTDLCKHVAVTLIALCHHSEGKTIKAKETCTQQLQSFHAAKPSTGSPVKAGELKLKCGRLLKDPRPYNRRKDPRYRHQFQNVFVGMGTVGCTPIGHSLAPANVRGYVHDHTYSCVNMEEEFLRAHSLLQMDLTEIKLLETATRQQSQSSEWRRARQMRLTASMFKCICRAVRKDKVAEDLLKSKDLTNVPAVRHGKQKEAVAVREFERISGHRTKPCGLFVHRTCPFLAASPDRLVDICGVPHVVEVKCPFAAKDYKVDANKIPYLFVGEQGDMQLKDSHEYYYQVQGQMACTGFVSCVFIVHTNVETKFFFIPRNDDFIDNMVMNLTDFFEKHFKRALLSKYYYKV